MNNNCNCNCNCKKRIRFHGELWLKKGEMYWLPAFYTVNQKTWYHKKDGDEKLLAMFSFLKMRLGIYLHKDS